MAPGTRTVRIMHLVRASGCEVHGGTNLAPECLRMDGIARLPSPAVAPPCPLGFVACRRRVCASGGTQRRRARAQSTGARAGGERARARELTSHEEVPSLSFPPYFPGSTVPAVSLSLSLSLSLSRCIIPVTRRRRCAARAACFEPLLHKRDSGTREDRESNARSNARGLCVLCAHWALAVCNKTEFFPATYAEQRGKEKENGEPRFLSAPSPPLSRLRVKTRRPEGGGSGGGEIYFRRELAQVIGASLLTEAEPTKSLRSLPPSPSALFFIRLALASSSPAGYPLRARLIADQLPILSVFRRACARVYVRA